MSKSTCIAKTSNENLAARYVARWGKVITENWSLELITLENQDQNIGSQLPPKYFISQHSCDVKLQCDLYWDRQQHPKFSISSI